MKTVWQCPKCGAKITVNVKLSEPAVCRNPKGNHTAYPVEMEIKK